MGYRNFEANYLISLLSSTLTQRMPPSPVRSLDWRELYYLAEFHEVTNISYYSLIGLYEAVPDIWRERFSKIFRKWVTVNNVQEKEVVIVMEALEEQGVDFMIMKDWIMKQYYPQTEMRAVEDIKFLIKPQDEKLVKRIMKNMEYHHEGLDEDGTSAYYKSIRCRFIFYQTLFPDNRKLAPYYSRIWKKLKRAEGFSSSYALPLDDFYIYMMAEICNEYAKGETDARHILDIHLFRKKFKEQLDRTYIDTELNRLELGKMVKCLEDVGDLWLGVYEGDETRDSRDVEEYIWSRGAYGREVSAKLMPMVLEMKIWQIRDARKKKLMKVVRWIFPKADSLKARYPSLERMKALLPLYWIFRWLYMGIYFLKIKLSGVTRTFSLRMHKVSTNNSINDNFPKDPE